MSQSDVAGLAAGSEALRRFLAGGDDLHTMLTEITLIAVDSVPGCELATITLLRDGKPTTPVFSDEVALRLDENQYAAGDGPCLAAIRHRGIEQCDVAADTRWPHFTAEAAQRGVRGVLSVPLVSHDSPVGGLNLYSTSTAHFDDGACDSAGRFADQVGVAAASAALLADKALLAAQLQEAMRSRAAIEQAKGILMAAQRCGPEEAFEILRSASQRENRKLREIAEEIVCRYASDGRAHPRE